VAVTAEVAGSQPAERAVLSPSQGTEKGPESTVRAVAVTATADNDSARGPQPVSRSAPPPQRTSDRGRNVPTQVKAPSTRSMGTQTKTSADGDVGSRHRKESPRHQERAGLSGRHRHRQTSGQWCR